ncbi:MAG: amidohydrolase [Anaerolinea sp.]|nr:amidohydrolase [Anaerolinea sp.]MCC6976618.1 amidohydrolase [Anaerolineae bacterium]CAG1001613.1 N-substituted formamide deformylase [Anaerolineae bacterium]
MDIIIINAVIYTLNPDQPTATSIALRDGRIAAVGGAELRSLATPRTLIHDLGGAMIVPGLTDAHIHWKWTAQGLREIDLFAVASKGEAVARVGQRAAAAAPGEWLTGQGWAQDLWDDRAFPTAADLDRVSPQNPVFLKSRSGHAGWANSLALSISGITSITPNPGGGVIQRDQYGHLTGILLETAMELVERRIPPLNAAQVADLMKKAQPLAWRAGLTGLHDFDPPIAFEAMQILYEQGELGLRIVKNINDPFIHHALTLGLRWGFGNDWLRLGGLKIFADGALGSRTAAMIAPYDGEPENYGVVVTDKESMYALVSRASRAGFPSTIHAIGDKAVHDVLDVYEAVRDEEAHAGIPRHARRHRIEHVQVIHPDDAGRLAQLDLIASMQPIHATADYQMADRYWGKRSQWAYNARLQLDRGARVAFGSDSPVEPFDPLKGIHAAVTRRRADGTPGESGWYPELRLSLDEALRGYTQGAAYAAGMEHKLGTIAPGFLADLTVFDRDLYQIASDDLLKVKVIGTMVGGEWRYSAW